MGLRLSLTLNDKVQLIRDNEQQFSYRELVDKYGISIGSISGIIRRKAKYIEYYEQNENSNKKRNLRDKFSQRLDEQVYECKEVELIRLL